jgi:hypothetical protein
MTLAPVGVFAGSRTVMADWVLFIFTSAILTSFLVRVQLALAMLGVNMGLLTIIAFFIIDIGA